MIYNASVHRGTSTFQFILLIGLIILFPMTSHAELPTPPPGDQISQGLWWLYHLKYDKARELFSDYNKTHPNDPCGYFYQTATQWWHLAQEFDYKLPDVQSQFENDYESTVRTAKALYETTKDPKEKARAALYWGGAEGLKGRWLVTQQEWVKAYFLGKHGAALLKKALEYDPGLYDAYMGLGIYDYFTDTLPGVQGVLAALFIHGDKKRGIDELNIAIQKGERSRIEATIFLVEIYTYEENNPEKGLALTEELRKEFPHSAAMHLAQVTTLFAMQRWDVLVFEASQFVTRL